MNKIEQAREEYESARRKLRQALIAIQTMRIDQVLDADIPDVRGEIDYLLTVGRIQTAGSLLRVVEQFGVSKANCVYQERPEVQEYEYLMDPDSAIAYLDRDP